MPDPLRTVEHESIREFLRSCSIYLRGSVLDFGCGASPYRDLIRAHRYYGYDNPNLPAHVPGGDITVEEPFWEKWDTILCTQVLEYIPDPGGQLRELNAMLRDKGHLVLTYPTNWPEVEPEDLHRFTKAGMERLLDKAGFEIIRHDQRAYFHTVRITGGGHGSWVDNVSGSRWAIGYGVVARKWDS